MKKIFYILILFTVFISCKSQRDECVKKLVDKEGYSYDEACKECDQMESDSETYR